jgi:hypothetical protein
MPPPEVLDTAEAYVATELFVSNQWTSKAVDEAHLADG